MLLQGEQTSLTALDGGKVEAVEARYSGQPVTLTMQELQALKMAGLPPVAYAVLAILSCKNQINDIGELRIKAFTDLFEIHEEGKKKPWRLTRHQINDASEMLEKAGRVELKEPDTSIQMEIF